MEINGRQNLSTPLAVKAGINFPYFTFSHLANGKLPVNKNVFKDKIFWIDLGKDLIESIRSRKKEKFSFGELIKPYLSPCVFAIPSLDDPLPCFKRIFDAIKAIMKKKKV